MTKYNSENIKVFSDVEAVQKHPHMYVGDNESFALYLILKEIMENAFDEIVQNGTRVVVARTDKGFLIYDDGRGIPVDSGAHGIPAIKLIFEKLNSGGKSNGEYGNATVGVHGVGCVVSNALSHRLMAASYRNRKWNGYVAKKGVGSIQKIDIKTFPGYEYIKDLIANKGTLVYVEPNFDFFGERGVIEDDPIKRAMYISSIAHPKKKYIYIDGEGREFIYKDEIKKISNDALKFFSDKVTLILKKEEGSVQSYVCAAPTSEHGTHWSGFVKAYGEAIQPYVKRNQTFDIEDAINVSGMLNYVTVAPSFSGQAKQKLKTKAATAEVAAAIKDALAIWVKKNKSHVQAGIEHAVKLKNIENKYEQEKTLQKSVARGSLPFKLASCPYAKPQQRELYLLEGDSAAGPAKVARDEKFQEVWPIRGKILNVYRSFKKAAKSQAVQEVLRVIGYSPDDPKMEKARIQGKIIILTDADSDGAHIRILLIALLWRFFPEAFRRKMVYFARTPIYSYRTDNGPYFGDTLTELRKEVEKAKIKFNAENVTRAKGWGEVSPKQLKQLAFDLRTRDLVNIPPLDEMDMKTFKGIVIDSDATYRATLQGLPLDTLTNEADNDDDEDSHEVA